MTKKNTLLALVLLVTSILNAYALYIPKGTFYFDNSLTKYSIVKFVFGSYSNPESYVFTMTNEGNNLWSITIPETVTGMYRYCFAETSLADGIHNESFPDIKDRISNILGEKRTATCELSIPVGWIFTPSSGNNWASGTWRNPNPGNAYSNSLPVMFINTDGGVPITSKDEYVYAEYYVDNMGIEGIDNVGLEDAPELMQIRGRGNYTWSSFDKKPYRLKLDSKISLLGMKRNKHWALMAHADDNLSFLRNTVGFELSRMMGLAWTPSQQPVEVVLNGDYIGLYMLTEIPRVEPDRVNVTEQADYETNPFIVSGGWLVEIDNYQEEEQIRTVEGNGKNIWSTYKSPEHLSDEQRTYLTGLINTANAAIYVNDKSDNSWEQYIDPDTLACYYIVQELLDDTESFHGSCFWHKENGNDAKIMFGPVWDFGNAYHRNIGRFIWDRPAFNQTWIGEIAKFPHFQEIVKKHWFRFVRYHYPKMDSFIDHFIDKIYLAAMCDASRWPQYNNADILYDKTTFKSYFNEKYEWLLEQWGEPLDVTGDVNLDGVVSSVDVTIIYDILLGNIVPDEELAFLADVDGDSTITATDITMIYDILLGSNVPPEPETGIVINVQCETAPYLYSWIYSNGHNNVLNGDWPGTQMSETKTTPDGITWWTHRFDVEYDVINIILNAGSSRYQTSNIEGLGPGNHYFIYDGQKTYQDVTDQY
ncbi:MAG: CotH kinase family protein [Muribaculaceae bacterium]|nr:CotH kinase family protein [Muribaculaceae bacterium]